MDRVGIINDIQRYKGKLKRKNEDITRNAKTLKPATEKKSTLLYI